MRVTVSLQRQRREKEEQWLRSSMLLSGCYVSETERPKQNKTTKQEDNQSEFRRTSSNIAGNAFLERDAVLEKNQMSSSNLSNLAGTGQASSPGSGIGLIPRSLPRREAGSPCSESNNVSLSASFPSSANSHY